MCLFHPARETDRLQVEQNLLIAVWAGQVKREARSTVIEEHNTSERRGRGYCKE